MAFYSFWGNGRVQLGNRGNSPWNSRICRSSGKRHHEMTPETQNIPLNSTKIPNYPTKNLISQQFLLGPNPGTFSPQLIHPKKTQNVFFHPQTQHSKDRRVMPSWNSGALTGIYPLLYPRKEKLSRENLVDFFSHYYFMPHPEKKI